VWLRTEVKRRFNADGTRLPYGLAFDKWSVQKLYFELFLHEEKRLAKVEKPERPARSIAQDIFSDLKKD
jgi:hypothetical protein